MSQKELSYILKVLEEGSFSKAAEKLYISQPSLSEYIKRTEKRIGTPLLNRQANTVSLTEAGKIFVESERNIARLRENTQRQINDLIHLDSGQVTIGSSVFRCKQLLTRIIPIFKERYPKVDVLIEEDVTENLVSYAEQGITDFSIVLLPTNIKSLISDWLFDEKIVVAVSKNHYFIQNNILPVSFTRPFPPVDFSLFKNDNFISMKSGIELKKYFSNLCQKYGFSPKVVLETKSHEIAKSLAGVGLGITIIPEGYAEGEISTNQALCYYNLEKEIEPRHVGLVYSSKKALSHAATAFKDILVSETQRNAIMP